jgi:hypothetical protein
MEIDITIRNATPVEAQRVLIGMSFAEDILGKLSPAVRIEKAERPPIICDGCHPKPCSGCRFERQRCKHRPFVKGEHSCSYFEESVPDPTCDEETGCAGCKDFGKNGACETCILPPEKKLATKTPGNRYGIPQELYTEDKQKYQRIWARCKANGITYEEALAMEGQTNRGRKQVGIRAPRKKGQGPAQKSPANMHPAPAQKLLRDLVVAKNGPMHPGQHVKHNGPKASPFFGKEGEILKVADDGQVFVKFGESSTWLSPHIVAVVPEAEA